jgi:hypothetical protein
MLRFFGNNTLALNVIFRSSRCGVVAGTLGDERPFFAAASSKLEDVLLTFNTEGMPGLIAACCGVQLGAQTASKMLRDARA